MKKALLIVCTVVYPMLFASAQQTSEQVSKVKQFLKSIDWTPKHKGEVNIGYTIAGNNFLWDYEYSDSDGNYERGNEGIMKTVFSRPLIEIVHGVGIGPYFFVGAGIGLQYYCGKVKEANDWFAVTEVIYNKTTRWDAVMIPIFGSIKFKYPINDKFTPFLNLGLGGTIGCTSSFDYENTQSIQSVISETLIKNRGGFYCDFGAGIYYKSLNFGIGLQHQGFKMVVQESLAYSDSDNEKIGYKGILKTKILKTKINSFYIKVGVNF